MKITIADVLNLSTTLGSKIDAGLVTSSGLTQTSGTLLGRSTPGNGAIEELTLGAGLSLVDGVLSSSGGGSASYPDFVGNTGNVLAVNATEDGVEWVEATSAAGAEITGFLVTATSTGVEQTITLPENDLIADSVIVTVEGMVQDPADYVISGTLLTLTVEDTGLSITVRRLPGTGGSGSVSGGVGAVPKNVTNSTYTPVIEDAFGYLRFTNATGCDITIPLNASVAFGVGTVINFRAATAGTVAFIENPGVTLNRPGGALGSLNFAEEGATVQIKKVGTDEWDIIGNTA